MMRSLRTRLFLSHLAISAAIIGSCVTLIVLIWYPPPFAHLDGIFAILLLMASVDVGAGPLCTLVAASPKKTKTQLARDLSIIGGVQLIALGYAIYTIGIARPAFVVYGDGRFVISHANELLDEELAKASFPAYSTRPMFGPVFVEALLPEDPKELDRIAGEVFRGGPAIKDMPRYFQPWPRGGTDARDKAKPVSTLPGQGTLRAAVMSLLQERGVAIDDAAVLPISGKTDRGTVVLRRSDLLILGVIPIAE
jgi:hypothetical protein